jgi:PHD/YefM family antitoxin component YafN of YafNO toxin-antitoxin module
MVNLTDIHSLTEFQRETKAHLTRLKRSGRPVVLTVNGKAAIVVQDAAAYQRLLDMLDRADAIEGVRRGLASMKRGEGRPLKDALEDLGRKYEGTGTTNGRGGDALRSRRSTRSRG